MPIYFFWNGQIFKALCTPKVQGGIPGFEISYNGRKRFFLSDGSGWSSVPFMGNRELKNRIGHAIDFYNKLK